jgi:hypothetical protein
LNGGFSARFRNTKVPSPDVSENLIKALDLDLTLDGNYKLHSKGDLSFTVSRAIRERMSGRWNLHIQLSYPF